MYTQNDSFEDFCKYILPYRFAEGICLDESRETFYKRHAHIFNDSTMDFRAVTDSLHQLYKDLMHFDWAAASMPIYNATTFEQVKRGSCDDKAWYNCLMMSALGMAVAIDFVPEWGNRAGGHSWNSLIVHGETHPFEPFWDDDRWKYKRIYNNECFDLHFKLLLMSKFLYLLIIISFLGCTKNSTTEKYQDKRNQIINVHDKVKEIKIEDVLIGSIAVPYSIDKYLIISDHKSQDKLIHVFDKNNFKYITSFGDQGQGPSEITVIGHIVANEKKHEIYVADHGKYCIFSYNLDSIITNSDYIPTVKFKIREKEFPDRFHYINDTLSIARIININGNSTFNQSIAKWNMSTEEILPMKYTHPDIERKRATFSVSLNDNIYVECYRHHDLMTICSLDGDLKYNIYGSKWDKKTSNKYLYYGSVSFANDYIVASYSGENRSSEEYSPTSFIIFNKDGEYIKTLETGYRISNFCYDKDHNRIIMTLDDDIQFAYLDLNGII